MILLVGCGCAILWLSAPFPVRSSYRRVLRAILFGRDQHVSWRVRLGHLVFVVRAGMTSLLWTLLWYLDEILFPAYRRTPITSVLYIAGQPRSGTTLLHRLLGEDSASFVGIRHIEWRYPFLCLQYVCSLIGVTRWLASRPYWPRHGYGQLAAKMHPHRLGDVEEDGIFFEERLFHHYFIFRRFPYPEIMPEIASFSHLDPKELERMLQVYRRAILKVLYRRGGGRILVLKENECAELLPHLAALFPQMVFVALVRNSNEMLASYSKLSRTSTLAKTGLDPEVLDGWLSANLTKRRQECELMVEFFQKQLPARRRMVLSYDLLVRHLARTVEHVYRRLGIECTERRRCELHDRERKQRKRDRGYAVAVSAGPPEGFEAYDTFVAATHSEHERLLSLGCDTGRRAAGQATGTADSNVQMADGGT